MACVWFGSSRDGAQTLARGPQQSQTPGADPPGDSKIKATRTLRKAGPSAGKRPHSPSDKQRGRCDLSARAAAERKDEAGRGEEPHDGASHGGAQLGFELPQQSLLASGREEVPLRLGDIVRWQRRLVLGSARSSVYVAGSPTCEESTPCFHRNLHHIWSKSLNFCRPRANVGRKRKGGQSGRRRSKFDQDWGKVNRNRRE